MKIFSKRNVLLFPFILLLISVIPDILPPWMKRKHVVIACLFSKISFQVPRSLLQRLVFILEVKSNLMLRSENIWIEFWLPLYRPVCQPETRVKWSGAGLSFLPNKLGKWLELTWACHWWVIFGKGFYFYLFLLFIWSVWICFVVVI